MSDEMVVIETFRSVLEAEAVRGRLEVEGIHAVVFADDAGGMVPSLQPFTGVRLLAPRQEVDRARYVLAALQRGYDDEGGECVEEESAWENGDDEDEVV